MFVEVRTEPESLPKLYIAIPSISKEKKQDLMKIIEYLPRICRSFL